MSLISRITARIGSDLLNEGLRVSLTGSVSAGSGNTTILSVAADRAFIVTGFYVSTDSTTAVPVSLSLGSNSFFSGYIAAGSGANVIFSSDDWRFGSLDEDVVINSASGSGTILYSVYGRLTSFPEALGYIERDANSTHQAPRFSDESGLARGQYEF